MSFMTLSDIQRGKIIGFNSKSGNISKSAEFVDCLRIVVNCTGQKNINPYVIKSKETCLSVFSLEKERHEVWCIDSPDKFCVHLERTFPKFDLVLVSFNVLEIFSQFLQVFLF